LNGHAGRELANDHCTVEGNRDHASALLQCSPKRFTPMRTKTSASLLAAAIKLAGHAAMGVALGLAFVIVLTRFGPAEIMTVINGSAHPRATLILFESTTVLSFAVGATLTGLVFMVTEDR
jgi:hypothetical protein